MQTQLAVTIPENPLTDEAARRAAFLSAVRRVSPELWLEHDRAVAEGYEASPTPMIIAVLRTIVESFIARLPEGVYSREVIPYDATERTSPSAAALDLRVAVAAIADDENAGISPELGQWIVSRVLRADVGRDRPKKVTVVRAEFVPADEARVPPKSILVSLEDMSEPDAA